MSIVTLALLILAGTQDPPSPEAFFGHRLGEDRTLAPHTRVVEYLVALAKASDRLRLVDLGKSTLGNRFVMAVLSTPENLKNALGYANISKTLLSGRGQEAEARGLARQGKAIVLMTCNLHSTEIASSQTAPELAYELVRGRVPLDDVVLLLIPSINPDGQLMIKEWYDKHRGSEFEGGPMPRLYHVYAGHDNNRDGVALNLVETQMVARVNYKEWFPNVVVDHHQMGSTGARMWVPPYAEPLNANVHPLIHRWLNVFGTHMALDLERSGRDGVQSQKMFEAYWPGATDSTPWWHNRIGILTESASCRIATPLFVDSGEATAKQEGNTHPRPWKGGTWKLRDIIDQQLTASYSILRIAGRYKEEILLHEWRMAREQIERGGSEAPYAYLLPPDPRDPAARAKLVQMLADTGVEVQQAVEPIQVGRRKFAAGALVIPLAQPERSYVKNLFERQLYPLKEKPYDVAGWTFPLQMGVEVEAADERFEWKGVRISEVKPTSREISVGKYVGIASGDTGGFRAANRILAAGGKVYRTAAQGTALSAGTFIVDPAIDLAGLSLRSIAGSPEVLQLKPVRLGLYQPWTASMDEGWTRLVLEQFGFPYATVRNDRVKAGELRKDFDALILPDLSADSIREGRAKDDEKKPQVYPPEYQGGIGKEGVAALKKFVEEGGSLICLDSSSDLAIEELGLPVRNVLKDDKEFSCPGSILAVKVDRTHPLGFGMPDDAHVYVTNSPAFQTSVPTRVDIDRRVVARYDEKQSPLASGYLNQPDKLLGRSALVELTWGKGRIVLFGFRPQHRAQTWGTFRTLFNAIQMSNVERMRLP